MKFAITVLLVLLPTRILAHSDGYFLWDSVELKSGSDYVIASYSKPNIKIKVKLGGAHHFESESIPLPGFPDLGRVRLLSKWDATGAVSNILEIPLVDGECRGVRFYLDGNRVRRTQFVDCHKKG